MKNKLKTLQLKLKSAAALVAVSAMSSPVLAAGGLSEATDALDTFKTWLYGFLGVGVLVYMVWQVALAMLEKQQWGDVFVAVGKVACAGGSIALATWAWGIWGS